jgi:hypothetical protein
MSDLSNDTKKHTTKYRETIPLNTYEKICLIRKVLVQISLNYEHTVLEKYTRTES